MALDMVAECALLNESSAWVIQNRAWSADFDVAAYKRTKAALCHDWPALELLLETNTAKVIAAIRAVPDSDRGVAVAMPWGQVPVTQLLCFAYWNMTYHEGQINYIASLLDGRTEKRELPTFWSI